MSALERFLVKRALFGIKPYEYKNPYDKDANPYLHELTQRIMDQVEEDYKTTGLNPLGNWLAGKGGTAAGSLAGFYDKLKDGKKVISDGLRKGYVDSGFKYWHDKTNASLTRHPYKSLTGGVALGTLGYLGGDQLAKILKFKENGFGHNLFRYGLMSLGGLAGALGTAGVADRIRDRKKMKRHPETGLPVGGHIDSAGDPDMDGAYPIKF